jgi:D-amino peptidase
VRVHIISDIEGVAGIVKWGQTSGDQTLYHEGRKLYTEEINAAVRGAKEAGATEIVVMDCHGAEGDYEFNSLIADAIDPDCEFVVQSEWTEYTEFLEAGCDAALFVGMHAKAGTPDGVLSHTVSSQAWADLKFNGVSVGETGINAALCGHWNCPVLLVTGDRATCAEARELLGDGLTTVEVKAGLGRFRAAEDTAAGARADRGRREAGAERHECCAALRPRKSLRDRDRVHVAGPAARVPQQARRRAGRCADARLEGRRLVDGLVTVLLLKAPGKGERPRLRRGRSNGFTAAASMSGTLLTSVSEAGTIWPTPNGGNRITQKRHTSTIPSAATSER